MNKDCIEFIKDVAYEEGMHNKDGYPEYFQDTFFKFLDNFPEVKDLYETFYEMGKRAAR